MWKASIVLALLAIIGLLLSIDNLGIGMSQNLTQNHTRTNSNVSNATANNPFLSGGTPFGSAALPP
jgi:hypothetical protein